jgi:uncharacterized membrane protein
LSEIVVALFQNESKANEAAQQLSETATQEGIVMHGAALLARANDGSISERQWTGRIPWKTPAGGLVGALIGALGGPAGAGLGAAAGSAFGFAKDVSDVKRAEGKLQDVRTKLSPGRSAIVVDLDERSLQTFSTRIQGLGGEVVAPGLKRTPE